MGSNNTISKSFPSSGIDPYKAYTSKLPAKPRQSLGQISKELSPRVGPRNIFRPKVLPAQPVPTHRPSDEQIASNVIRRAGKQLGLSDTQTETVVDAYQESVEMTTGLGSAPGSALPVLNAPHLLQVAPEVFLAMKDELESEAARLPSSISRAELDQWFGFKTQSATAEALQTVQSELAGNMGFAAINASVSSDAAFLSAFSGKAFGSTPNPDLAATAGTLTAIADRNAKVLDFMRTAWKDIQTLTPEEQTQASDNLLRAVLPHLDFEHSLVNVFSPQAHAAPALGAAPSALPA